MHSEPGQVLDPSAPGLLQHLFQPHGPLSGAALGRGIVIRCLGKRWGVYVKYIAIYSIKGWVELTKIVELTVFNMILHIQVTKTSGRIGVHHVWLGLENPITGMNLMFGKWMENNGYSQGCEHYSTETCTRVFTCIDRMLFSGSENPCCVQALSHPHVCSSRMDADDDEDASFPHHGCGPRGPTPTPGQNK